MQMPTNPLITQDPSSGEWWYNPISHPRLRMTVQKCVVCGEEFLRYYSHKTQTHCSRACQAKCRQSDTGHCPKRVYDFAAEKNGRWKGGRFTDSNGYIKVWIGSRRDAERAFGVYEFEHRLVMSQILGRELMPGENVHHINGVRDDNRRENLELWVESQPSGQRVEDKLQWARELLAAYEREHCDTCTCYAG